jgi:hypothetical protein
MKGRRHPAFRLRGISKNIKGFPVTRLCPKPMCLITTIGLISVFAQGQTQGLPLHSSSDVIIFSVIEKYQNL